MTGVLSGLSTRIQIEDSFQFSAVSCPTLLGVAVSSIGEFVSSIMAFLMKINTIDSGEAIIIFDNEEMRAKYCLHKLEKLEKHHVYVWLPFSRSLLKTWCLSIHYFFRSAHLRPHDRLSSISAHRKKYCCRSRNHKLSGSM